MSYREPNPEDYASDEEDYERDRLRSFLKFLVESENASFDTYNEFRETWNSKSPSIELPFKLYISDGKQKTVVEEGQYIKDVEGFQNVHLKFDVYNISRIRNSLTLKISDFYCIIQVLRV